MKNVVNVLEISFTVCYNKTTINAGHAAKEELK